MNETGQVAVEQAKQVLSAAKELTERVRLAERSRQSVSLGSCAPVPIQDLKPLLKELYESVSVSAELNDSDDALVEGLWQGRYREEVLVRDYNTGEVLERIPGNFRRMPDGQNWLLV